MRYLVDTDVLLRWILPREPLYRVVMEAIEALHQRESDVYVTAQNLIEFWNAATRPQDRNGFGMTPDEASRGVDRIKTFFRFAEDTPVIFDEWLTLARDAGESGVQVHDARLVAVMRAHGLTHLLTLNPRDFTRYTGIQIIEPRQLAGGGT